MKYFLEPPSALPSTPFRMAKSDAKSIRPYRANFLVSVVFAVLYSISTAIQFCQKSILYRSTGFLRGLFGVCLEVGGYVVDVVSIKHADSIVGLRSSYVSHPKKDYRKATDISQPPYAA